LPTLKIKIMDSTTHLIPVPAVGEDTTAEASKENLKLWLCELTHLNPQQVEVLMAQMEQQPVQPSTNEALGAPTKH
jgi:hypothetical protein